MPTKKQYNLVNDDAYDSRIPLHSEEAFHHGIPFHVKLELVEVSMLRRLFTLCMFTAFLYNRRRGGLPVNPLNNLRGQRRRGLSLLNTKCKDKEQFGAYCCLIASIEVYDGVRRVQHPAPAYGSTRQSLM
ncbi:Carboxyl-terminal PDZ ligand of neuronal nitric oxide synthase protein [Nymphon striatum]|nr:Carboxyl-terminal PDZ ligand of neuronal nitric oxide synthase protein [Nymphon striatum]